MSQYSRRSERNVRGIPEEQDPVYREKRGGGASSLENRFPVSKNPRSIYTDGQTLPIQKPPPLKPPSNRGYPEEGRGQKNSNRLQNDLSAHSSSQSPTVAYRGNQPPIRPQPQYSQPVAEDNAPIFPTPNLGTPSMSSSRSKFVECDPSAVDLTPPPPLSHHQSQQKRIPPSSRRGIPPYYSQGSGVVSPIPEESRHGSFASSHVIPSSWGSGPGEFGLRAESDKGSESEGEDTYRPVQSVGQDDERGLVRQASLGRKSKPTITEIRSQSRQDPHQPNFFSSTPPSHGTTFRMNSPAEKSSPTLKFPAAPTSTFASQETSSPLTSFPARLPSELASNPAQVSNEKLSEPSLEESGGSFPPVGGRIKGRNIPSRLNMNAIREAEARGSLTSLPDLIRRATKLAAALEQGRPDSRWGMRNSMVASSLSSSNRRTDSISDILGSFPLGSRDRTMDSRDLSQWQLPSEFQEMCEDASIKSPPKRVRRICGLPLWAFILLVILALLVIAAAIIVPLQLVTLSRSRGSSAQSDSDTAKLKRCKETNLCQNGGMNILTNNSCGCICAGGYGGPTCSQSADSSCVTMNLHFETVGNKFDGLQNATVGSAIQRLLQIAQPQFNVELDASKLLSTFSSGNVSCTAQNALITFNGEAMPPDAQKQAASSTLGSSTPTPTSANSPSASSATATSATMPKPTATHSVQLDEKVVDFARVAVLWLAQSNGLQFADEVHEKLQDVFKPPNSSGSGQIDVGNGFKVDLDLLILQAPGNIRIGGAKPTATSRA